MTARELQETSEETLTLRDARQIQDEALVVWDEDVRGLRYVREEITTWCSTRQGPIAWRGPGRRVGYTVLRKDAPNNGQPGRFTRRVFWLRDNDNDTPGGPYEGEGAPIEGVDPLTVAPREPGRQTDRAWGRPGTNPA